MAIPTIEELYEFSLIQLAAEFYREDQGCLDRYDFLISSIVREIVGNGCKKSSDSHLGETSLKQGWPGILRMANMQLVEFFKEFEAIHQWVDDPSTERISGSRPRYRH